MLTNGVSSENVEVYVFGFCTHIWSIYKSDPNCILEEHRLSFSYLRNSRFLIIFGKTCLYIWLNLKPNFEKISNCNHFILTFNYKMILRNSLRMTLITSAFFNLHYDPFEMSLRTTIWEVDVFCLKSYDYIYYMQWRFLYKIGIRTNNV